MISCTLKFLFKCRVLSLVIYVLGCYLNNTLYSLKLIFLFHWCQYESEYISWYNLTFQLNKISHSFLKPNIMSTHGYIKEAVQYTDNANDNCLAGCLECLRSQCWVVAKYLVGAWGLEGILSWAWVSTSGTGRWREVKMVKSSPPTDVASRPMTFTPDPFTI